MGLFSKLGNRVDVTNIKKNSLEEAEDLEFRKLVEEELIFGSLNQVVDDVFTVKNEPDTIGDTIKAEGESNADFPENPNDNGQHDLGKDGNAANEEKILPGKDEKNDDVNLEVLSAATTKL